MLSHLPLLVGTAAAAGPNDPLHKYQMLPGDLRADELLAVSSGQVIETKELSEFKFPEPKQT